MSKTTCFPLNVERRDSDAVLSIYERLRFPWSFARIFRIMPTLRRDPVYRLVARNRYRMFGRRDSCWVAPEHYRDRIVDRQLLSVAPAEYRQVLQPDGCAAGRLATKPSSRR